VNKEAAMNILILDGSPAGATDGLDRYLDDLVAALAPDGHEVARLRLRELDVHYCVGCFGCWMRTPGECAFADDGQTICRSLVRADLAIFASPILMGHVSALLRRANERCLPLIHPYIRLVDGESRHRPRYARVPRLGLLLAPGPDADDDDVAIIEWAYQMTARNFATRLAFTRTTGTPAEEVAHAAAAA
jgi:hypothetical protein